MFGLRTVPASRREPFFGWLPEASELFRPLIPWSAFETSEWPYRYGFTLEEKDNEVLVRAELPGFAAEEIKLEVMGEQLVLEAEHKEAGEKETQAYAHVKRVVTLPAGVEFEKAEATYRNGVLEVRLPRKTEAVGRKIEVKT